MTQLPTVFERLSLFLQSSNIAYREMRHQAVFTSEEAAQVRGTSLNSGAKALVCKSDDKFALFVVPAGFKLDSKKVRKSAGIRSLRFATREEVEQLTGLKPGSIPPFGSLFQMRTFCEPRLAEFSPINFNAGDHSISISMTFDDYVKVESPTLAELIDGNASGSG